MGREQEFAASLCSLGDFKTDGVNRSSKKIWPREYYTIGPSMKKTRPQAHIVAQIKPNNH